MFANILTGFLFAVMALLVCGSLLSLSSNPHWFIRGWDFPRLQIVSLGWVIAASYFAIRYFAETQATTSPWIMATTVLFLTGWYGTHMLPYLTLYPVQVKGAIQLDSNAQASDNQTIRFVVSNVEEENDQYERWMQTIEEADPDVLVAIEIDERWVHATRRLIEKYPYRVVCPQSNWYGMMMLSRLPIERHELRFLVQDDVPSIDALIRLKDATLLRVVAVHPRPPEPIRGNDATARDAELTLWGQELASETQPVIIGGDLNDVAWSTTTRLFLRTSGLLDPRRGRGFFNTFNANHFFLRFPVDHVFVSPHFVISGIERLSYVGSDHFPMRIDLRYEASQPSEEAALPSKESDNEEVKDRVERAIEDPKMDGEAIELLRNANVQA